MTITSRDAKTSTSQGSAPLVIVSCDTHIGPRLREDLRPYCPEELLEDFDAYAGVLEEKRGSGCGGQEARVVR